MIAKSRIFLTILAVMTALTAAAFAESFTDSTSWCERYVDWEGCDDNSNSTDS